MLTIFRGDDTGGTLGRSLYFVITIPSGTSVEGCHAEFIFDGITKQILGPLVSGESREIFYSHNETAAMALGTRFATFRVIDAAGKVRTLDNTVAVRVTDIVSEAYPGSDTASVIIGMTVSWAAITNKPATFPPSAHTHAESEVTGLAADLAAKITNPSGGAAGNVLKKTASGVEWGEASGGTTDYTDLSNKPQINSHELVGNQTLAALGIEAAGAAATAKGEAIAAAASDATQKANAAEAAAKNYTNSKLAWHTVELSDPEDGWEQPFTRVTVTRNTTYDLSTLNGFTEDESLYGEFALQFDVSGLAIGDEFSLVSNGDGLLLVNGIEFIGHDEDWVRLGVAYSYNDAMVGAYLQQMMSGGCEMMMTFKVVNIEDTGVTRLSVYGGNNNYVVES